MKTVQVHLIIGMMLGITNQMATSILIKCSRTGCPKKSYLIFYFEAAKLLMSEILVFLLL